MIFSLDRHSSAKALYDAPSRRWLSYGELRGLVREWGGVLTGPSKTVAFNFCRNDVRSIAMYLGCMESGNPVALLDDGLADEAKARLMELYRPEFVSSREPVPVSGYELVRESLWHRAGSGGPAPHPDLALLLSTSGSTGSPRFVRLTRRNVESNAESISQVLNIGAADCAITSLPIHYSYGLSVLNTHLLCGASLALTGQGLMEPGFWETFRAAECTSFAGVPYLYQILKRLNPERLNVPSLNTMTQAGGRMDVELIERFSGWIGGRGGRFFVMYGQTEATARISILPAEDLPAKLGSVGKLLPGGSVEIRGDEAAAELIYHGPNVMMGYAASRDDLALGDELHGALPTGDRARVDEDGYLYINGRAKRDAKVFGLRINLDEVESMLRVHGPVAVIGKGEQLCIYLEQGDAETFARHRSDLAERLRVHHSAFTFVRVEKLPVTSSGKIDYPKLAGLP